MKYILVSLSECSKLDFSGADKLSKTDHLILLHAKGKKTISAKLKETLSEVPAQIDYYEIGAASELWLYVSYLIGVHTGAKHDVYVITEDKEKIPAKIAKEAKVYSAFRSVSGASGSAGKTSSTKKSGTTAKKATAAKKSSTTKKTTSSKSSTKKASTSKSSSTKNTSSKKKSSDVDLGDIGDFLSKSISSIANQYLKGKK